MREATQGKESREEVRKKFMASKRDALKELQSRGLASSAAPSTIPGLDWIRNMYRAVHAFHEHGGLKNPTIPNEHDDGEVGTNAWPVPSWWNRVPAWWDRAPQWWLDQTVTWAEHGMIATQAEADLISAVN